MISKQLGDCLLRGYTFYMFYSHLRLQFHLNFHEIEELLVRALSQADWMTMTDQ